MLAEGYSKLIEKEYIERNEDGITNMDETEEWDPDKFSEKILPIEKYFWFYIQGDGLIESPLEFGITICETIDILKEMTEKMMLYFENLNPIKQEYFDDPSNTENWRNAFLY
jgi:hypothetical protein